MSQGTNLRGLFRPGAGRMPPLLAGRTGETQLFRDELDIAIAGDPPASIYMHGPRGNGKTCLGASWRKIVDEHDHAEAAWVSGTRLTEAHVDEAGERAAGGPLVLFVDEAHNMAKAPGENLLVLQNEASSQGLPLMVVLMGTPELPVMLDNLRATFRERNEELRIGLLSSEEAAAAIHVPLAETIPNLRFEPSESSEVVADSGRYPFFVQLWGRAIARNLDASVDTTVTRRVVADAWRSVEQQRSAFYQRRLGELAELNVVHLAYALAENGVSSLTVETAKALIGATSGHRRNGAAVEYGYGVLEAAGYLWRPDGATRRVEPGIPSLWGYVGANAPKEMLEDSAINYGRRVADLD